MEQGKRIMVKGFLFLAALGLGLTALAGFAQPQNPYDRLESAAPAIRDEVIAEVDGTPITRELLYAFILTLGEEDYEPEDALLKEPETLRPLVERFALNEGAVKKVEANPESVTDKMREEWKQGEHSILLQELYQAEVMEKIEAPTEEEVQAFYEANQKGFTIPLTFAIRHIFVSNYKEVETSEEDTLENLAREISGDVNMVNRILVDNPAKTPRAADYPESKGQEVKPLEPGEHLLVPLSEAGKQEKYAKIQEAQAQLKSGDLFTSVAALYSENATKGKLIKEVGKTGRPMLPIIVETIENTPEGEFSDIFETKHGYNILYVEWKKPAQVQTLDDPEVRQKIERQLSVKKQQKRVNEFLMSLLESPDLELDLEKIKNPETAPDTIVGKLGEETFTRGDLVLENLGTTSMDMDREEVMKMLSASRPLTSALLRHKAYQLELDETPRYRARCNGRVYEKLRTGWMVEGRKKLAERRFTEKEAKAYFEKYPENFREDAKVTLYLFGLHIPEGEEPDATLVRAAELLAPVKSLDDFQRVIEEHGETSSDKGDEGLLEDMPFSLLRPALQAEVLSTPPGEMSRPVVEEDNVLAAWVVEKKESAIPAYENIQKGLPQRVKQDKFQHFDERKREELLQAVEIDWSPKQGEE